MKWWMKSKGILGAVGFGVVKVLEATGHIAPALGVALEGIAATLFGVGVRQKQEKNAEVLKTAVDPATGGGSTGGLK